MSLESHARGAGVYLVLIHVAVRSQTSDYAPFNRAASASLLKEVMNDASYDNNAVNLFRHKAVIRFFFPFRPCPCAQM